MRISDWSSDVCSSDLTLVERTRRVVRFTGLGNAIVEKAHRVLREAEELADMAAAAAAPLVGELRMSVIPTIAPFLLPGLLPRLRSEEHTSELPVTNAHLVCRLLLEKKTQN